MTVCTRHSSHPAPTRIQIDLDWDLAQLLSRGDKRVQILDRDYQLVCQNYAIRLAKQDTQYTHHEFRNFKFLVGYADSSDDMTHVDVSWPNAQHGILLQKVDSPQPPPRRPSVRPTGHMPPQTPHAPSNAACPLRRHMPP